MTEPIIYTCDRDGGYGTVKDYTIFPRAGYNGSPRIYYVRNYGLPTSLPISTNTFYTGTFQDIYAFHKILGQSYSLQMVGFAAQRSRNLSGGTEIFVEYYIKTSLNGREYPDDTDVKDWVCLGAYLYFYNLGNAPPKDYQNNPSAMFDFKLMQARLINDCESRFLSYYNESNAKILKVPYTVTPSTISGTYIASNGLKYYYQSKFNLITITTTSNVVNYVTEWGLDTNYGNTYSSKNYTFTESNASNSVTLLTNAANTEIDALKTKFDTYIGPVTPPGEKKGEYTAVNGIKYYWKTTFTGSNTSLTAQTATITVTTVWGKTNTYGNTFATGSHIIKPNNYATYQTDLETLANTQKGNLQMQLDRYIGDVTAPAEVKGSVVATNGITYYYKTSYSGASSSLTATSCPISVVTDWGTSTSYGTRYTSESFTITASNYKTRTTDLQNVAKRHLANLTNYLNTLISTVTIPAVKAEEWSTNTGKVYIKTTYSKKSESATEYVMYYKTEWGLTNSYGNVFVNNATISINANNYKTRETVFTSYHNAAVANLKKKVSFLNASTPAAISNSYKAKNGITYYYKQTWAFVSRDISKSVYRLTTTYGTASNANTTTNYDSTTTLNVNVDNIANVSNAFSTLANTKKEQLCAYLDTLIINVTAPAAVANTFAATNGLTYAYRTTFTLSNKTNSEVTVTVKTEWGKNTTYGNTFATSEYKITSANQQTFANQNETIRQDHVTKLQAFLNKLIDTVTFGAKTSTYEASNGTMYYIRTRVEGKSVTYAS